MSLRDALRGTWRPPTTPLSPTFLPKVVKELERNWADVSPQIPPEFELDQIIRQISEVWRTKGTLSSLSAKHRRWVPYSLYYPLNRKDLWLGHDSKFVAALLELCRGTPRLLISTLRQILLRYPTEVDAFTDLRDGVTCGVREMASPRLNEWKRRLQDYHLLDQDGPCKFAHVMKSTQESPDSFLLKAGFDQELAAGEFVRSAMREYLVDLESDLTRYPDLRNLADRFKFVASERSLRFPLDAHLVAHGLLRPFITQQPSPGIQEHITEFLLRYLKDPRFERANWQRVEASSKGVFLRWISGATLEDFFALIAKNARESHWKYRHAFWRAYLKRDLISDAWVVLGDKARRAALSVWKDVPPYGILREAPDSSHSVLLLRIGSLTIAERSHDGSCRIWKNGNRWAPKFYERTYRSHQLMDGNDEKHDHHGSERFTWQNKLANSIRSETGYTVSYSEYQIR